MSCTRLERPVSGGVLELLVSAPDRADSPRGLVLLPPHPLLAGDADNNVVRAVAEQAVAAGLAALRFNYRGVGASRADGPAVPRYERFAAMDRAGTLAPMAQDAREALRVARGLFEVVGLVGYSFGAAVGVPLAAVHSELSFVGIAPPLDEQDFSGLVSRPGLFVFGEIDEVTPAPRAEDLDARFPHCERLVLPGRDHFFRGDESRVAQVAIDYTIREASVHGDRAT